MTLAYLKPFLLSVRLRCERQFSEARSRTFLLLATTKLLFARAIVTLVVLACFLFALRFKVAILELRPCSFNIIHSLRWKLSRSLAVYQLFEQITEQHGYRASRLRKARPFSTMPNEIYVLL